MSLLISGDLRLANTYVGIDDPDAQAYIAAVEAADEIASPGVGALEIATKVAIHSFVKGCKNDGIWPAIKASCILAGARTLAGALVPLVGAAPTNVGGLFVSGDYNRETGLVGNASTKYLLSGVDASPTSNNHVSVYASTLPPANFQSMIGSGASYRLQRGNNAYSAQNHTIALTAMSVSEGFIGASRSSSSSYVARGAGVNVSGGAITSESPTEINIFGISGQSRTSARLAFYSIGESLDLALLDARVTTLINAFAAAIP